MGAKHINVAIQKGIGYLEPQLKNGLLIEDFGVSHGLGISWPTAFVKRLILEAGVDWTSQSLDPLLKLQEINGGWAYNENVAADADTTTNVLICYGNRLPPDSYKRGLKFVLAHQNETGGIMTWTEEDVKRMGYEGGDWSMAHSCVTALALRVLEGTSRERAVEFLRSKRLSDGSWPAYWWPDKIYTMLECLGAFEVDAGIRNYIQSVKPTSAFGLSLKIRGLIEIGADPTLASNTLLRMQSLDCSWGPSDINKIPRPYIMDETIEDVEVVQDKNRTFSTAAAVLALSKVRHLFLR